jgi:phosphotransferase system HPr (HPr) family protein
MSDKWTMRRVTVSNPLGLHARPAHALVTLASRFQADIQVVRNGEVVDGKSILSVLTLAAEQGTELMLKATGSDAEQALAALEELFRAGFGEAEEGLAVGKERKDAQVTGEASSAEQSARGSEDEGLAGRVHPA